MRLAIATFAVLALAASSRGGCDGAPATDAPAWGCEGLSCGDGCGLCPPGTPPEHCPVPTFAPTACDPRGQCVTAGTFSCAPEACAGKTCGDECAVTLPCHDSVPPCLAPVRLGACTVDGVCVTGPVDCEPFDPCAGKACGDDCRLCPPDAIGCYETMELKACDAQGRCVSRTPGLVCP